MIKSLTNIAFIANSVTDPYTLTWQIDPEEGARDELHSRFGENDNSTFRGILDFGFDGLRFVFQRSPFYGRYFSQSRGQEKRSRDPASLRSGVV